MENLFEQSKALFTDEMNWATGQWSKAGEAMVADAEKLARTTREAWDGMMQRQVGLMTDFARHATGFAEKQMQIVREAWTPKA